MKRRKQLEKTLAARRKKAERTLVESLNDEMNNQQSVNEMKLAEHHKQQVVQAEIELIRQALETADNPDVYTIVKQVLSKRHQDEANQLEDRFGIEREELLIKSSPEERDLVLADWEYRYNQAKVNLKSTHYSELVDYLEKFNPETARQVERKNAEIDAKRKQYEKDEQKLAQKLEADLAQFEKAQNEEMAEKLRLEAEKMDLELEAERQKLLREVEDEISANEKAKAEEKAKEKEIEEAKKRGANENEMQSILEKWTEQEDKNKQDKKLLQIQRKQAIEARLQRKKAAQTEAVSAKLEEEKQLKKKEIELANIEAKAEVLAEIDQVDDQLTQQAVEVIESVVEDKIEDKDKPLTEDQFEAKLKASSLVETLNLLKEHLPNDNLDELFPTDEFSSEIIPCLSENLNRQEKLTLKFARCIASLLSALDLMRPISVLVAVSMPRNTEITSNPFVHAYSYDSVNRILYLRRAFLASSPGTISVAIQHACAHINSGDLRSDNEPRFRSQLSIVLASVASFFLKLRAENNHVDLNRKYFILMPEKLKLF